MATRKCRYCKDESDARFVESDGPDGCYTCWSCETIYGRGYKPQPSSRTLDDEIRQIDNAWVDMVEAFIKRNPGLAKKLGFDDARKNRMWHNAWPW